MHHHLSMIYLSIAEIDQCKEQESGEKSIGNRPGGYAAGLPPTVGLTVLGHVVARSNTSTNFSHHHLRLGLHSEK
jgi:hypothetical protein